MRHNPDTIKKIAKKRGWKLLSHRTDNASISFTKVDMMIIVWYTKMTVMTAINHPKWGRTQLYRQRVGLQLLDTIFRHPRVHSSTGYYR